MACYRRKMMNCEMKTSCSWMGRSESKCDASWLLWWASWLMLNERGGKAQKMSIANTQSKFIPVCVTLKWSYTLLNTEHFQRRFLGRLALQILSLAAQSQQKSDRHIITCLLQYRTAASVMTAWMIRTDTIVSGVCEDVIVNDGIQRIFAWIQPVFWRLTQRQGKKCFLIQCSWMPISFSQLESLSW